MSNKNNKTLKPGWRRVKFGEVVRQCKEKADPETSGLERYIAGDHMDTDDLRVRRWGEIGSGYLGPAFNIRFKPGQVLYGSRRTYLRKVAVADFEGICANTTLVLEPINPNDMMPGFLPFLMQSEAFTEYSIKNSKGSVNPFINFSDLAKFEFSLPPASEQMRISRLLTAFNVAIDGYRELIDSLDDARNAMLLGDLAKGWIKRRISEVARVVTGKTPPTGTPEYWEGNVPFATPGDLEFDNGKLSITTRTISESGTDYSKVVPAGSTLVVCIGSTIGKVAQTTERTAFNQQVNAIVCQGIAEDYMYAVSTTIGAELRKRAGTTAVPIINKGEFEKIQIPVPPFETQIEISKRFFEFIEKKAAVLDRLRQLHELKAEAANLVFAR